MEETVGGRLRHARFGAHQTVQGLGWATKVLLAAVFAGFLALTAQVSFPVPWTPVPFSMQVLGVLLTGAYLGRNYGLLSIAFYILAGALGLQVFADQQSTGIEILTGATAGYIVGFAGAAYLVGWYVERRRALLDRRAALVLSGGLGVISLFGLVSVTWLAFQGGSFDSAWSATQSLLWLFAGMVPLAGVAAWLLLRQAKGHGWERLNLFLVMMAAIALIHLCGVLVLKPMLGLGWPEAVALGSTVFLPFDLVKAALAASLSLAFLPTREDERHFMQQETPHA